MIETISKEAFKKICKLNKKQYRDKDVLQCDILLEGERLIKQVLANDIPIKALYIREGQVSQYSSIIDKVNCPIYSLSERQSEMLSETRTAQGIFAQVLFQHAPIVKYERLLYLNGISDPGNLGTILRTAAALAIDGVLVDERCCYLANSKLVRASLGAVFTVPIEYVDSTWLSGRSEQLVATHTEQGIALSDFTFPRCPYILIIGSEADGISTDIDLLSPQYINIPMSERMESLNVSVAAGILMYKMMN